MRGVAYHFVLGIALLSSVAHAADITDVASSFEPENAFDFRFRFRYDHTEKRAQIKRELEGLPGQTAIQNVRDIAYQQSRDSLALRAELGLYHDLMLSLELPIILNEQSTYQYDKGISAANSTTVNDGIISTPYDATTGSAPTDSRTLLKGAQRGAIAGSGGDAFDTFNVGLTWAPFSQKRDHTKPTWILGFEGQFSVGTIKKFDRLQSTNHGVSEGIHRLIFKTAVSRRLGWFEPYIGIWYLLPIPRSDSLFVDRGPNQISKSPQHQAGTSFGVEAVPFDRPKRGHKIAIDLRGRIEAHFNGLGYSEAFELLAGSPGLACNAASQNLACDPSMNGSTNTVQQSYQGKPYTGLTNIENYTTLGADAAVTAQISRYSHFRVGFDYTHDQSHLITGDDIGQPGSSGRVTNAADYNPAYRPIVDLPGRRYRVDNVNVYTVYLWGQVMF